MPLEKYINLYFSSCLQTFCFMQNINVLCFFISSVFSLSCQAKYSLTLGRFKLMLGFNSTHFSEYPTPPSLLESPTRSPVK
jgi:hypothetical protein